MKTGVRGIAGWLLRRFPARSDTLFAICRRYVDRYRGENDSDPESNGELEFLRRVLPRCRTVFDVGAHSGEWAAAALAINPELTLHCFEPSRASYQRLLAAGLPARVSCVRVGLSSAPRTARLFSPGESVLASLYQRGGVAIGAAESEEVSLETGDDYCLKHGIERIDYLKLDVEGHELEALRGLRRIISERRVGIVQFEYGGCNIDARVLLKDLFAFFEAEPDVSFFKLRPSGPLRVAGYLQSHENFQNQNWAVVLRGPEWPELAGR
jgi:FkbM family methyltransferase